MSDLEYASQTFDKIQRKYKESKVVNDYFDGALSFRVFGFLYDVEKWYDVFAKDKDEARRIISETIADFDIDQIIKSPQG